MIILALAVLLQWYGSRCGLLLTDDSRNYISASLSFKSDRSFLSPDGTYFVYWPPLFPILLSMFSNAEGTMLLVNILLKLTIGGMIWLLATRFIADEKLRLVCLLVAICGVHLTMVSVFLWSELFFIALLLLHILVALRLNYSAKTLIPIILTGALLCLQRSAGLLIVSAITLWMLTDTTIPFVRRATSALSYFIVSSCGVIIWMMYVRTLSDEFQLSAYGVLQAPFTNASNVLSHIGELFLYSHGLIAALVGLFVLVVSAIFLRRELQERSDLRLIALIAGVYIGGLCLFGRLAIHDLDRLLSPVVPLIYILPFAAAGRYPKTLSHRIKFIIIITTILWSVYPVLRSWQNVQSWQSQSCLSELHK